MNRESKWLWIVPGVLVCWPSAGFAADAKKPKPPSFSIENDLAEVLHEYPLGTITRQEAFAFHGGPIHKVKLPNGEEGWLYRVGEEAGLPDIYVLEFSDGGVVIDVLHKSYRYKIGHSALQYQYLQHLDSDVQHLEPRPGEEPGLP
jgi:hypothetical protein